MRLCFMAGQAVSQVINTRGWDRCLGWLCGVFCLTLLLLGKLSAQSQDHNYGRAEYQWEIPPHPVTDVASDLFDALARNSPERVHSILQAHPELLEHPFLCQYRIRYPEGGWPNENEPLTPLQIAAAFGDADLVAAVCSFHPKLEQRDRDGRTPLWVALALRHNVAVGAVLLDHGADLQAVGVYAGSIWSAQFSGDQSRGGPQLEVIQFLLDWGLDPRAQEYWPERMLGWMRSRQSQDVGYSVFIHEMNSLELEQAAILYRYSLRWPRLLALLAMAAGVWIPGRNAWREWRQRESWQIAGESELAIHCKLNAAGKAVLSKLTPREMAQYARAFGEQNRMGGIVALYWMGLVGVAPLLIIDQLYQFDVAHLIFLFSFMIGFVSLIAKFSNWFWAQLVYLLFQSLAAVMLTVAGGCLAIQPWLAVGPVEISAAGVLAAICGLVRLWWLRRQYVGTSHLLKLNRQIRRMARQQIIDSERTDIDTTPGWDEAQR